MSSSDFYRRAEFLTSASKLANAPPDEGIEIAFAGRSNAGKSSAINALCGQRNLARTSRTPGRTQLINFFTLDPQRKLVDLPGYGFAKVSLRIKEEWQRSLSAYLEQRSALRGVILVMDIRHPLKEYDLALLDWASQRPLALHILLTKADKLKRGPALSMLQQTRQQLADYPQAVSIQLFSALKQSGLEESYRLLDNWFERHHSADSTPDPTPDTPPDFVPSNPPE